MKYRCWDEADDVGWLHGGPDCAREIEAPTIAAAAREFVARTWQRSATCSQFTRHVVVDCRDARERVFVRGDVIRGDVAGVAAAWTVSTDSEVCATCGGPIVPDAP